MMTRFGAHRFLPLATGVAVFATLLLLVLNVMVVHAQVAQSPVASAAVKRGTASVTWPRAVRALQRGEVVRANDYVLADTAIAWHWNDAPADTMRSITGWVARRAIAAGEFMHAPAVAPPHVVMMGSAVKVLWQDGPVSLTLVGTATNNAALGAPVGVRIDRNRRLDGVAVGSNIVRLR